MTHKKAQPGDILIVTFLDHHSYRRMDKDDEEKIEPVTMTVWGEYHKQTTNELVITKMYTKGGYDLDENDLFFIVKSTILDIQKVAKTEKVRL